MTEESIYTDESIYKDVDVENRKSLSVPDKTKSIKMSLRKSVLIIEKQAEKEMLKDGNNKSSYTKNLRSFATELPNKFGDSGKSDIIDLEKEADVLKLKGELPEDFLTEVWAINYREAAIYLLEGLESRSFEKHPENRRSLNFYLLVNNPIYQCLDFLLSAALLVLGYFRARHGRDNLEVYELIMYLSIGVLMTLKTSFLGLKGLADLRFHGMTITKWVILLVLIVDSASAIIVHHGRYFWCLKIFFIIDCYYTRPLRKLVREIYHTLPSLLDMLFALMFCTLFFSVAGYNLFSTYTKKHKEGDTVRVEKIPGNPFFESFYDTFMNMFVLINTGNFPEIMTFSQDKNAYTFLFFVLYNGLTTVFILNLMVAIIYESFESEDIERFKETFMRKREAVKYAFELLVSKSNPRQIAYVHFSEFIPYFLSFPKLYSVNFFKKFSMSTRDKLLNFKLLDKDNEGFLTLEEFYSVYEALEYTWIANDSLEVENFIQGGMKDCWDKFSSGVKKMILNPWFDRTVIFVVVLNCVVLLVDAMSDGKYSPRKYKPWSTVLSTSFAVIYFLEMVLKLIGLGARKYFSSPWNILDFFIAWGGAILEITRHFAHFKTTLVSVARSLKFLSLFRLRETFREVFETMALMFPKIATFFVLIFLGQYGFAEVGIELFGSEQFDPTDCCNGTIVANFYNTTINGNITYSHFGNKTEAFVTLFALFLERNWEFAVATEVLSGNPWSRVFFMLYQIWSIIMFAYITAVILHTFLLKTRYKEKENKEVGEVLVDSKRIVLNRDEVNFLNSINEARGSLPDPTLIMTNCASLEFEGINFIVTDELHQSLNEEQIKDWIDHENFFDESNKKKGVVVNFLKKSLRSKSIKKKHEKENERGSNVPEPEIIIETPPNDGIKETGF